MVYKAARLLREILVGKLPATNWVKKAEEQNEVLEVRIFRSSLFILKLLWELF